MSITHIVLLQFKQNVPPDAVQNACKKMLGLREQCLHPSTTKPYILSVSGGKDNSPEGKQGGITHAFIMKFKSAADREYYLTSDPIHQEFAESLIRLVEKAQVVDFTPGIF
ncbi:Dabb family protein [Aspergillus puulaauensis]|uniref:Stress-response A/B barrel domain-containing protein n=1 Tax=Aspergillus puulaauensis TaxID=1220207 RepID=A0A7R7XVV6_9EURO|nr:uncharacterized protein APUU_60782A [Aspergillus puulaauensis]BCS27734.1 hypothetical protein APUU_60782A [Aspergillus puulaauensis]